MSTFGMEGKVEAKAVTAGFQTCVYTVVALALLVDSMGIWTKLAVSKGLSGYDGLPEHESAEMESCCPLFRLRPRAL